MSKRVKVEAWVVEIDAGLNVDGAPPTGVFREFWFADRRITQEMVEAVRECATLASPEGVTPASAETFRAADILQALLDAGGDDE